MAVDEGPCIQQRLVRLSESVALSWGARGQAGQHLLQLEGRAPICRVGYLAELAAGNVGGCRVHHCQDNG